MAKRLDPEGHHRKTVKSALADCPKLSYYSLLPLLYSSYRLINFDKDTDKSMNEDSMASYLTDIMMYNGSVNDISEERQSLEQLFDKMIEDGDVRKMEDWFLKLCRIAI